MATVDPIQSLCGALTQATGGMYHVDLRMPDGIHRLAEVVDLLFGRRIVGADVRERCTYIYICIYKKWTVHLHCRSNPTRPGSNYGAPCRSYGYVRKAGL